MRAVCELRQEFNLGDLLKLAEIPRSTYYAILKRLDAEDQYAALRFEIRSICEEHKGRYGYRRVTAELHNRGRQVNHKVVMRLMKESHLTCKVRMKKYRSYRGEVGKVAPNLINRDFHAQGPYRKLTTDITEFSLFGAKLYLSPVLDMYNGEILSYVISDRPALQQVTEMLDQLFERIPEDAVPIMHSDQGWQYQHALFRNLLKERNWIQSMSCKGNCLDNSPMENFFGLLKSELLYLQEFDSIQHFRQQLEDYIDYYNNKRIKSKLKGMSPVQYRTHSHQIA